MATALPFSPWRHHGHPRWLCLLQTEKLWAINKQSIAMTVALQVTHQIAPLDAPAQLHLRLGGMAEGGKVARPGVRWSAAVRQSAAACRPL